MAAEVSSTELLVESFTYAARNPDKVVHITVEKEDDAIGLTETLNEVLSRISIEFGKRQVIPAESTTCKWKLVITYGGEHA